MPGAPIRQGALVGFSEQPLSRRGVLGAAMVGAFGLVSGCASSSGQNPQVAGNTSTSGASPQPTTASPSPASPAPTQATAAQIAARATVPVLCYHQVRPYESGDSTYTKELLVAEPAAFEAQLDAMKAAGYTTIGPDAYLEHLTTGKALPAKPVMLSFDDGKNNQPGTALPALLERGMTGTWYIMTVVIGNSGWTTKKQIREMADAGITIGCHTYDHNDVRKYAGKDFTTQFDDARKKLQDLSGQPVDSFAYPYGAWNPAALPHLAKAGFSTGFQLDEKPLDPKRPLLTLRRSLAVSTWTGDEVVKKLDALSA